MGRRSTHSAGRFDDTGKKQMQAKRRQDEDREYFESCIEQMEEDGTKTMPLPKIVKYHDYLEKIWGWDRLVPWGVSVPWSDYSDYLEAYYNNTSRATQGLHIAAIADTCHMKEKQLVSEWKIWMKSKMEMILPMRKSIVLSCLIHQCASSVIHTADRKLSSVPYAALWCIAKEADLTCELLRHGADPCDNYLIEQSSMIRMCALSLMNCTLQNSVSASAAMLGMAREAEMMCDWMSKNHMLLDVFDDFIPDDFSDSHTVRVRTMDVMFKMLEESSAAAGGHKIDGAANTTWGSISDLLNSHYQKIKGSKKSNKRKRNKEYLCGLWGWERLLPLCSSVDWSYYSNYLEEYYNQTAFRFVADAAANQNPEDSSSDPAAGVVKYCLKMEEELVSKWKTRVRRFRGDTLSVSIVIQSSLIKERALSICSEGSKFSVSSAVAFACITMEADLICELLKHGAEPIDDMIQQSIMIRMCALGLVNLEGHLSIACAAAMVGMAKEAKMMSDWMKRENKLLTFILSGPRELEGRAIRTRTLDFVTNILRESSFPSKTPDDAMALD